MLLYQAVRMCACIPFFFFFLKKTRLSGMRGRGGQNLNRQGPYVKRVAAWHLDARGEEQYIFRGGGIAQVLSDS